MRTHTGKRCFLRGRAAVFCAAAVALSARNAVNATSDTDLCSPQADPCLVNRAVVISSDSIIDVGQRHLLIAKGGDLHVGGGRMTVKAGRVTVEEAGSIHARGDRMTGGGRVTVLAPVVTIAGIIDASGADGGMIEIHAGTDAGGAITIAAKGAVTADALIAGGWGGNIKLSTAGLHGEHGDVTIDGLVAARGKAGTQSTGGGSGGSIEIAAGGDVRGAVTARVIATGGGPDGDGGQIDFKTMVGSLDLPGLIDARTTSAEGMGGSVSIAVAFDLIVRGEIVATGGGFDGGDVDLESLIGSISVAEGCLIDVGARQEGNGGSISIDAAPLVPGRPASFTMNGTLKAVGGGGAGDGGAISLLAADDLHLGGAIEADGGSGGAGGNIDVLSIRGSLFVSGRAAADGRGNVGGSVWLSAKEAVDFRGEMVARGDEAEGGRVAVDAGAGVNLAGNVLAGATGTGGGGRITVASGDTIAVDGALVSDGGPRSASGAMIELDGCEVRVDADGMLSSLAGAGVNRLIGHERTVLAGTLRARVRNEAVYRRSDGRPDIAGSATISPPLVQTLDPGISACPTCGDGIAETPETCDDGNRESGDGCSADCRSEPTPTPTRAGTATEPSRTPTATHSPTATAMPTARPICPGDCNGDDQVTVDELVRGVRIALGDDKVSSCSAFDVDTNGSVSIDELVRAVRAALDGCAAPVNPTPTPTQGALTCRVFSLIVEDGIAGPLNPCDASGGTCLLMSKETGAPTVNGTNGRFDRIPLSFEVCGPGSDGFGTIRLAEAVHVGVGLPPPAKGKICYRLEPDPAQPLGFLDCRGDANADVELVIDSRGAGPTGDTALDVGVGPAPGGPGSAVVRLVLQSVIVDNDSAADCAVQNYSNSPRQVTAFTTGKATTIVLNARHRLGEPVTATAAMSGGRVDCALLDAGQRLLLAAPLYTLDVDIPVLGGVADFPQVLRLAMRP